MTEDADDRATLLTLSHRVLEAVARHDSAALDNLLSPGFVLLTAEGRQDRSSFLEGVRRATFDVRAFAFDWIDVEIVGRTAVVAGVQRVDVVLEGMEVTSRAAFTDVFVIEGDRWRLAAAHSTDLAVG